MNKIVIVGIDGATWNVIDPMLEKGELPNIKYLVDKGTRATLESFEPRYTPIIWTSIATGKMPNEHGVYQSSPTRNNLKSLTIWDILENEDYSIGIFNWKPSWPPRETNGFWIPGGFSRTNVTFPRDFNFILEMRSIGKNSSDKRNTSFYYIFSLAYKAIRYGLRIRTIIEILFYLLKDKITKKENIIAAERCILGDTIFTDLYLWLYRKYKPYFSAFYVDGVDAVAHLTWKYYQPHKFGVNENKNVKKYGKLIPSSYKNIDKCLGRILKVIDNNTAIFVISDHGTKSAKEKDFVIDINADKLFNFLEIKNRIDYFECDHKIYFSINGSFLDQRKILHHIKKNLNSTDDHRFFLITETEIKNLYSIEFNDQNIEMVTSNTTNFYMNLNNKKLNINEFIKINDFNINSSVHDNDGIFIAYGKNIRNNSNKNIEKIKIIDICPTFLYYMHIPVAKDMKGNVIYTIFKEKFIDKNQIKYISTYQTENMENKYLISKHEIYKIPDVIKDHLKRLGYIE